MDEKTTEADRPAQIAAADENAKKNSKDRKVKATKSSRRNRLDIVY